MTNTAPGMASYSLASKASRYSRFILRASDTSCNVRPCCSLANRNTSPIEDSFTVFLSLFTIIVSLLYNRYDKGYRGSAQILLLYFVGSHQNIPRLTAVIGPDDVHSFHHIDHAGRPRIADAEAALEHRRRSLAGLENHIDGLTHEVVFKKSTLSSALSDWAFWTDSS